MKIVFMGTPEFSVKTLEALVQAGHEILAVVTQPDKRKGRGKELQFPPVKEAALAHGFAVYQPEKVKTPEFVEILRGLKADLIVVVAFGQILSKEILELYPFGCVNVHASLLPAYRGAAPYQWAIINGEKVTGVTTQQMNEGIDTGDIIEKMEIEISPEETAGSLHDKLSVAGAELCVSTVRALEDKTAVFTPQKDEESSYAKMLSKEMGNIDWSQPAKQIECLIRGLNPWPSAYTKLEGKTLKIWKARVISEKEADEKIGEAAGGGQKAASGREADGKAMGSFVFHDKKSWLIQTGEGLLGLEEVQLEGKRRMSVEEFLRGFSLEKTAGAFGR